MKNETSAECRAACYTQPATYPYIYTAVFVLSVFIAAWLLLKVAHSAPAWQESPLATPIGFEVEATPLSDSADTLDPFATGTPIPGVYIEETEPPDELREEPTTATDAIELPPVDRPIIPPPPTQAPSNLDFLGQILISAANAAAWIWLTCGSLVFFIVAGIVAGLYFSQRQRKRYQLYSLVPEETAELEIVQREAPRSNQHDDDIWPASLP